MAENKLSEKTASSSWWASSSSLLERLRPSICLMGDGDAMDSGKLLEEVMPDILRSMDVPSERNEAMTRLWRLTTKEDNRVAVICRGSQWDVLDRVIGYVEGEGESVRTACLVLNNLSVPTENKAVMALGQWGTRLITALLSIMQRGLPEAYLCCTCLANLTFLEDAVQPLLTFVPPTVPEQVLPGRPPSRNKRVMPPLRNPMPPALQDQRSLIRAIEYTLQQNAPFLLAPVTSTQGEALRRSCHLLRNLSAHGEGPPILALTAIPKLLISFIKDTNKPVVRWTFQSLEDAALATLCHLARDPCSKNALSSMTDAILEPIISEGGIHAYRASAIHSSLHS